MTTLKRIGPMSCGKVGGVLYGVMGLILGVLFALFSLLGAGAAAMQSEQAGGALFGALFGVGAVVLMPIFYGVLGFVSGVVTAWIYNVIAGRFGGIELEIG